MIVSVSYRTDIPAFHADWFARRLAAGEAWVRNPYGGADYRVSLRPDEVAGFVFWSRNTRPFRAVLRQLAARAVPFVVQYSITGYPAALEPAVPPLAHALDEVAWLSESFGRRAVVWRYDPVLISDLTPPDRHLEMLERIGAALAGRCDEVVVSFAHVYRKTRRRLAAAAAAHGFSWSDPRAAEKQALRERFEAVAARHGLRLTVCSQPAIGGTPARCIDTDRLSDVAGRTIAARTKGNRPGCACAESRDIGAYDSCAQGCVYCYAVSSNARARARIRAQDPDSPTLGA